VRGTAPSRSFEVYNHALFSRSLGFSGHKEMLSVNLAMLFKDSSWRYSQKGKKKQKS